MAATVNTIPDLADQLKGRRIRITRTEIKRLADRLQRGDVGVSRTVFVFDDALPGFGLRISRSGGIAYCVQGRPAGSGRAALSRRMTIGRHPAKTPEEAREEARVILSSLASGKQVERRKDRLLTSAALDLWLRDHVSKLKPRTRSDYAKIVAQALKPALGHLPIAEVQRSHLIAMHQAQSATPRRANYNLAAARSFFSFAESMEWRPIDSNPARRVKQYRENRRERFLSHDEIQRAAEGISQAEATRIITPWAAAALRLALLTGARQGELASLTWTEVDFERRMLLLKDSKTGAKPVYLSEPAIEILSGLPRSSGNPYVFAGRRKEVDHLQNLGRAWIKARALVGLDDVRAHDLRHSHASIAAAQGHSLQVIGKLLGHAVPATTARYAHLAADPIARAAEDVGQQIGALMKIPGSESK